MAEFIAAGRTVPAENGWKWIAEGWELFKRQPGMWIALIVIFIVISIILAFIPVLGTLASMVLGPVFAAGLVIGCRALDEGGELKIEHLFAGFRERFGTLAAIGAIYLVATVLIVLVAGLVTGVKLFSLLAGTSDPAALASAALTLMLALLIMLALMVPVFMAIWFAPPLAVFHQLGALEAMKASFAGCLKNIVPFLVYGVILLVASIVASIPFGLGWLVLGPVIAASIYTAYREIYFS